MMAPELSQRDRRLLDFVAQVRVVRAGQLERAFFPVADSGSPASAARRCRRVLARLSSLDLLRRLDRRVGGVRSGSSGWLYTITSRGLRVLGETGRARRREPSERFVAHALAAVELHVDLLVARRSDAVSELTVSHEPATWRRFSSVSGIETLKPDLLIELVTLDEWELRWFVEVDRSTEHLPAVYRKCLAYQRYWRSGHEATHSEVFPRVLWSVPDEGRAAAITDRIRRSSQLNPDLYVVATARQSIDVLLSPPEEPTHLEGGET